MKTWLVLAVIIGYSNTFAQNSGKLEVKFDPGIESAINSYTVAAQSKKTKGFRVQLCSESGNNARNVANSIKSTFLRQYDGVPAYLIWDPPNFKVRVGDFKNRLDATLFWKQILNAFPQAYVVVDEVNMLQFD